MKINKSLLIALFISFSAHGYDGKPIEQIDSFFENKSKNSSSAIDDLYSSNPAMKQKAQALTMMKSQMPQIAALFGEYLGYEVIENEQLSPSLKRVSVLEKRNLHPVTWEFYFYKPKDKWILSQANFVDQFQNIGSKK